VKTWLMGDASLSHVADVHILASPMVVCRDRSSQVRTARQTMGGSAVNVLSLARHAVRLSQDETLCARPELGVGV
jgi:hypothetical protein